MGAPVEDEDKEEVGGCEVDGGEVKIRDKEDF